MKKILLILTLSFLFTTNVFADIIEMFCLVKNSDLRKANLNTKDYPRFAGKEITFAVSFEEKLIADISEDGELSIITGMYGIDDAQEFEKIYNGIRYKNEIEVDAGNEKLLKYSYVNVLKIVNNKPTKLLAKVDQTGFSINDWYFQIDCRDYKFSEKEKLEAKKATSPAEDLIKTLNRIKEKKATGN